MRINKTLLASVAALGLTTLVGCASKINNQPINIASVPSFVIEVLPERAACERVDYNGNKVNTTCVQIRHAGSQDVIALKTDIKGFVPAEGTHYLLDVRQVPVPRLDHTHQQPIWSLNKIIEQR